MTKGEENRLKLKGQFFSFLSSILSGKTVLSDFAQTEHPSVSYFLVSVDLSTSCIV
jgi:hypothetical protein